MVEEYPPHRASSLILTNSVRRGARNICCVEYFRHRPEKVQFCCIIEANMRQNAFCRHTSVQPVTLAAQTGADFGIIKNQRSLVRVAGRESAALRGARCRGQSVQRQRARQLPVPGWDRQSGDREIGNAHIHRPRLK